MKNPLMSHLLAILVASPIAAFAADNSLENDPGYLGIDKAIDLKTVRAEVNVNLPRFLLKDAASSLNGGPDDPFAGTGINVADLVKDVKLIRVVVIEAGETNRSSLEKGVQALRAELDAKWTVIVTVPDENVGVYVRSTPDGESMSGLAVLIYDDGDAVIANVVGQVSVGKLLKVAAKLNKFPKDLLKKLAIPESTSEDKPAAATEKPQAPAK